MLHTTCTEDRIQHALDRCLAGLRQSPTAAHPWNAGQSMNRWSLEELVKRDPENFLILLQQIIRKTKEVQEQCQYELVAPLAIMFFSTLLQTPHCPADSDLLQSAMEVFRLFLTWPEPYCSVCKNLLSTLQLEIRAPGISFQRLVREEQGLSTSKTMTVLLMNPGEVPADFLLVAEQLSRVQHSQRDTYITLIKHAFQSALGAKYSVHNIHAALQDKSVSEVAEIYSTVKELLETAALMKDPMQSLYCVAMCYILHGILFHIGMLQTLPLPTAKCHMFYWEKDNFDVLNSLVDHDLTCSVPSNCEADEEDEIELDGEGPIKECSPKSVNKARLSQQFYKLFRPKSPRMLYRAKSLGNTESKDILVVREKRSNSLPQQVHLRSLEAPLYPQNQALRHVCFRRRPILSSDEDSKNTTLRVVVFGADHVAGKVARAYSSLRRRESTCPHLTRAFKLQFYFVPVKRDLSGHTSHNGNQKGTPPSHVSPEQIQNPDATLMATGSSTNDIAHLLGMLDPWYERNTLSLLNLPSNVVCQQTSKTESDSYDSSYEQRLPILADLVLYYCRYASKPTLIQLYQAELTLAGGEKRTEVFVHSLELGHAAGTRAVKALGAASKRFGIDGDREAVPLTLDMIYNRVVVSGRSQWKRERKVCTSVNLTKACKNPEELDSKMEYLQLSMTEIIKRQSGKSKKGYNQVSFVIMKVDKVQITGADNTFAVCLDQDEKKILQSVTRCEISVCYKTDSSSDWNLRRPRPSAQIQPLNPAFCSLLCLPITTFSGALP
uniref:Phosphoinositide 3-kinase regulatory subunit 5 n=1 Tax=Neogobius melanostomus TaxID=47308 RepID=A0A8C6SXV8_9GOBI